jgi:hypothetical protein
MRPSALRGYVFDVGGDPPLVAKCVLHRTAAVAVWMVGGLHNRPASCGQHAPVHVVAIRNVEVEHPLHRLMLAVGLAHLQIRIPDFDGRVLDYTIRCRKAAQVLGIAGPLQKVDERLSPHRMQEWLDVRSAFPFIVPLRARRDVPEIAGRVLHTGRAFAVGLVGRLGD